MIVCLGDSITYGQFLANRNQAWPALLRGRVVQAAGVPGETTRLALERFPNVVQADPLPDAVVIQYGHNDANRWVTDRGLPRVSEAAFAANLEEMITRARAFGVRAFLCTITPSRRSVQHGLDCERYNAIISEVAMRQFVPLINVWAAFLDDGLLLEDGLHLSERGHVVYAEVVQRMLDREKVP